MADDVRIRAAAENDLPAVAALAARLVRLHHAIDPLRFMCVDDLEKGYERFFRDELPDADAVILVAERGAHVVGYTFARIEPRNWNDLLDACAKLHDVFVDESARGTGAAEALLRATLARLEELGAPRVILLTAFGNEVAQKLFARTGFRNTMIEMTCELNPKSR